MLKAQKNIQKKTIIKNSFQNIADILMPLPVAFF